MLITITRKEYLSECTLGELKVEGRSHAPIYTLERPWLDNKQRISCIPIGRYKFHPHNWEDREGLNFSKVWQIANVPNRTGILIHAGNTVVDCIGCVLVGLQEGELHKHPAVLRSQAALSLLRDLLGKYSGDIVIEDSPDIVLRSKSSIKGDKNV